MSAQQTETRPETSITQQKYESGPDLIISALKAYRTGDDKVEYEWIITNIGNGNLNLDGATKEDHDNLCVQAFMSKDTVFDPKIDVPAAARLSASRAWKFSTG